jgi:hypothetical protein
VVILHLVPQGFLHRLSTFLVGDSSTVVYWGKLLDRAPWLVASPDTYFFLWILVIALTLLSGIATVLALSSFLLGYRKMLNLWRSVVQSGLGILSTGTLLLVTLVYLITRLFTLDTEGHYTALLIGTKFGGMLYYAFIAYRIVSSSLTSASKVSGIRTKKIIAVYCVLAIALSAIARLLTPVLTSPLPHQVQSVADSIPFIPIALGNLLLVFMYRGPSDW